MKKLIIDNIETNYSINEEGKVYNNKTKKLLKGSIGNTGYISVRLTIQGKKKGFMVHRLVAQTFIPNPKHLPIVNHIDGNKINNRVENLEWVTQSQNRRHAIENNISQLAWGERQKIDENEIDQENWIQYQNTDYYISKNGQVWNKKTKCLLKQTPNQSGYIRYTLRINNKSITKLAHVMVMETWGDKDILSTQVINHINGDKTDNNIDNLEIVSKRENALHACYVLNKNVKPVIRITDKENIEYSSLTEAANQLQISVSAISYALKNKSKCYNSYWEYK